MTVGDVLVVFVDSVPAAFGHTDTSRNKIDALGRGCVQVFCIPLGKRPAEFIWSDRFNKIDPPQILSVTPAEYMTSIRFI